MLTLSHRRFIVTFIILFLLLGLSVTKTEVKVNYKTNVQIAEKKATYYFEGGVINDVAISGDGRYAAVATGRYLIYFDGGVPLWNRSYEYSEYKAVDIDASGTLIVAGASNRIFLYDSNGNLFRDYFAPGIFYDVRISRDGEIFAGYAGDYVYIFNSTGTDSEPIKSYNLPDVTSFAMDDNGRIVIIANKSKVEIYNISSDSPIFELSVANDENIRSVSISGNGLYAIVGCSKGTTGKVYIIDVAGGSYKSEDITSPVTVTSAGANGSVMLAGTKDGHVYGFNWTYGGYFVDKDLGSYIRALKISHNELYGVAGCENSRVYFFIIHQSGGFSKLLGNVPNAVDIDDDGVMIACGGDDGTFYKIENTAVTRVKYFCGSGDVVALRYSRNENYLAVGTEYGLSVIANYMKLWESCEGIKFTGFAFSQNNSLLFASGSSISYFMNSSESTPLAKYMFTGSGLVDMTDDARYMIAASFNRILVLEYVSGWDWLNKSWDYYFSSQVKDFVLHGNKIYVGTWLGNLTIFPVNEERILGYFYIGDEINSLSIKDNYLLVATENGTLLLMDRDDLSVIWKRSLNSSISKAKIVGDKIVLAYEDGLCIYGLNGTLLANFETFKTPSFDFSLDGKYVIFENSTFVWLINLKCLKIVWNYSFYEQKLIVGISSDGHNFACSNERELVLFSLLDSDSDGLTNDEEIFIVGTDPLNPDTDGDGLSDADEYYVYSTDPTNPDTDGDGWSDYDEIVNGGDPLDPRKIPEYAFIRICVCTGAVLLTIFIIEFLCVIYVPANVYIRVGRAIFSVRKKGINEYLKTIKSMFVNEFIMAKRRRGVKKARK